MMPISVADRLKKPDLPIHPNQAEQGAYSYWLICLPCHGDRGQGLTDEWRAVFGPEDQNCWQSKCHAPNHPPQGFEIPRTIPPVLGPSALTRLSTAQDLYRVIADTMPLWDPDHISDEDAWNLTAYLMRERKVLPARITLNAGNASVFRLHGVTLTGDDERLAVAIVALLLIVSALAFAFRRPAVR
ncbi:MAG TPA: c-type cytochrome [Anaerolineae bacterium]|nr:c-type cytochrome [Anaerolineae bacterium]